MNLAVPFNVSATGQVVSQSLKKFDPRLFNLIHLERENQAKTISLIASENYTPKYCSDALSSCLSMKYSEGYPGDRYYAGNRYIDQIEELCRQRALAAFSLRSSEWGVNVQSLSGSPANFAVYTALLQPKDRILYLDLPHGGHLSHGFGSAEKPVSATAKYFECKPYKLNKETELIDYDELESIALKFRPKLIIAGYSAYPRLLDYARFRHIADRVGALLLGDIAHIAGPMSARLIPSAFEHCDVVTTTTHKTLRGPRGALIFSRKPLDALINKAVFPGCQGGPHNHSIAAIASSMKACATDEFEQYQKDILQNARIMSNVIKNKIRLVTGGTDNHLVLLDLKKNGINGNQAEAVLESVNIITNKNSTLSDTSPKNPNGLRIGSPAMTTRGLTADGFDKLASLLCKTIDIASVKYSGLKSIKKFKNACAADPDLERIKEDVAQLAKQSPVVRSELWN